MSQGVLISDITRSALACALWNSARILASDCIGSKKLLVYDINAESVPKPIAPNIVPTPMLAMSSA